MNLFSKWALTLALAAPLAVQAQFTVEPVLQRGYDANVSGANLTESTLNASNINPNSFGLLFKLPVDERIYAQPLYVPNVAIPNMGLHNVLYVATMNDTVYAFDADASGAPLWSVNLASLFSTTAPVWLDFGYGAYTPPGHIGVLSTPVIDLTTHIMYVVACTLENATMAYRLHAIDITTGAEPYGPGVLITGSYSGIMLGAPSLVQRMSLVLADNQVIIGFGAMQDEQANESIHNYVGWVLAYDKRTLQQSGVFAPGTSEAGIWQDGRPPAVDGSGFVYFFTGNTRGGGWNGTTNFSESALKLDPSRGLALVDYFTIGNWQYLDANDLDLASSGPLLIPGTSLLAGGGKTGDLYVLDTANLGQFNPNDSQVVQKEHITAGEIHGGPVYWQGSATSGGPLLYDWGGVDVLKAYAFNGSTLATSPSAQGTAISTASGGFLTVSANGNNPGSGVLWANIPGNPLATPRLLPTLHAYDAENITQEIWNSSMNVARDTYGIFAHSMPPLVVNGRVYLATGSNQVVVYGLFLSFTASPTSVAFGNQPTNVASAPLSVTVTNTGSVALPITSIGLSTAGSQPFSQTNTCGASLSVGASCRINVVFDPAVAGAATATLSISAGGGAGIQTVTLAGTGVVTPAPIPTLTLTATPASLTLGGSVTLTWTSTNSASCVASRGQSGDGWAGTISVNGTAAIKPIAAGTITYSMTCSSGSQSVNASAHVVATSTPSSGSPSRTVGGGGGLDAISLLSLLAMVGCRQRRSFVATTRRR